MNFGISVGDFLLASQLAWKLFRRCKAAPKEFALLSTEVSAFHVVLKEASEQTDIQNISTAPLSDYQTVKEGCYGVLHELEVILNSFEGLQGSQKRIWDRARWSSRNVESVRIRLISHTNLLTAFNNAVTSNSNASAQERIESKLELILAEIKAGHREHDILTETSDSLKTGDNQSFRNIRRALVDLGIDEGAINDNEEAVISWMNKTIQCAGDITESFAPSMANSHSSTFELSDQIDSLRDEPPAQRDAALAVELVDLIGSTSEYADGDFPTSLRAAATHLIRRGDLLARLQSSTPLFICRPLIFPEILRATIEDVVTCETTDRMIPATMLLHQRQSLKPSKSELPFPSQARSNFIEGFLVLDLSPVQRQSICDFYGSLYKLATVRVAARLQYMDTMVMPAEAYLWNGGVEESEMVGEWNIHNFMQGHVYRFYMSSAC